MIRSRLKRVPPEANTNDDWLVAHQQTQSKPLSKADYKWDIANEAQANFISLHAADANQTSGLTADQLLGCQLAYLSDPICLIFKLSADYLII